MGFDETGQEEISFGYANLVRTFMGAGIQPPPIPQPLRSPIFVQDNWCWGSKPVSGFEMYTLWNYLIRLLPNRLNSYVAVSHAGHGINSYGLQFALGYGPLVVVVQNCLGGAYSNHQEDAHSISRTYNQIKRLLKIVHADAAKRTYPKRVVLIWSEFRSICQYAVQDYMAINAQLERIAGLGACWDTGDHDSERRGGCVNSSSPELGRWKRLGGQVELFDTVGMELEELIKEEQK